MFSLLGLAASTSIQKTRRRPRQTCEGSEVGAQGALGPEWPARPQSPASGRPGGGGARAPAPGTDPRGRPQGSAGVAPAHLSPAPTSGTEPHGRLLTSALRASRAAPSPQVQRPLWDAPVASGVGCPRYRVSAAERVPAARHSHRQVPGRQSPGRAARRALACAPPRAPLPRSAPLGSARCRDGTAARAAAGAPALGRPFPELARPG